MKLNYIFLFLILTLTQSQVAPKTTIGANTTLTAGGTTPGTVTAIGNQNSSNFYTTATITTSSTALVGDRIVIVAASNQGCNDTTGGILSITDNAGTPNTYAQDAFAGATGIVPATCIWSAQVTSQLNSGGTITLTCQSSNHCNWSFWANDLHPSKTSGALEQAQGVTQSFGTAVSIPAAGALTSTDQCLVSLIGNNSNTEMGTWGGGFTNLFTNTSITAGIWFGAAYITPANSGTTPTATMTLTSSDNAPSAIACYKEF